MEMRVEKPIYKHVTRQRKVIKPVERVQWQRRFVNKDVVRLVENVIEKRVETIVEVPVVVNTVTVKRRDRWSKW